MSERCRSMREKLSAFVDGELPPAEEAAVREHLAGCEGCRDAIAAFALVDRAIASEDLSRPEEDWERLASRVDAAVTRAHEADLHAERTVHGWRKPPRRRGFLGGLLPAPVAFGSAGTIVAALLVVLFRGLLEEPGTEPGPLVPESVPLVMMPVERETGSERGWIVLDDRPVVDVERAARQTLDRPQKLGFAAGAEDEEVAASSEGVVQLGDQFFVRGGRSSEVRPIVDGAPVPAAPPASSEEPSPVDTAGPPDETEEPMPELKAGPPDETEEPAPELKKEAVEEDELRPIERELVVTPEEPAEEEASSDADTRTLDDFAQQYAQRASEAAPDGPAGSSPSRGRWTGSARTVQPRQNALSRTLEEHRREQEEALERARAQEIYFLALDRREEGDREGAVETLTFLLGHEDPSIRERAWQELIDLDGAMALETGDSAEILRVASAAEAFLREYPRSAYRKRVLKRRLLLWGEAVASDPDSWCASALAAEADWRSAVGAVEDPQGSVAAERIRNRCNP